MHTLRRRANLGRCKEGSLEAPFLRANTARTHPASQGEGDARDMFILQLTKNKGAFSKVLRVRGLEPSPDYSTCLFLSVQIKNSSLYPEGQTKSKLSPLYGTQSVRELMRNQKKPTDDSSSWGKVNTLLSFHFSPAPVLLSAPMRRVTS